MELKGIVPDADHNISGRERTSRSWQGKPRESWQGKPRESWQGKARESWQGKARESWQDEPRESWQDEPRESWQGEIRNTGFVWKLPAFTNKLRRANSEDIESVDDAEDHPLPREIRRLIRPTLLFQSPKSESVEVVAQETPDSPRCSNPIRPSRKVKRTVSPLRREAEACLTDRALSTAAGKGKVSRGFDVVQSWGRRTFVPEKKQSAHGTNVPEKKQSAHGTNMPGKKQSAHGTNVPEKKQSAQGTNEPQKKQSAHGTNVPDAADTKKSNFRHWQYSKKVPFDKYPLLSALCHSETNRGESAGTWFLPLRCFTEHAAADALNLQQKYMERVQERHGGEVAHSEDCSLFASLWGVDTKMASQGLFGTDIPMAKIIPTLFWIGHTERYSNAQKTLAAAFYATRLCLENLTQLLHLGNAIDTRTQVELGSIVEHLGKLNGERVVEFFQRKYQHWFQQLNPAKGRASVFAVCGMLASLCPEFMRANTTVTRKKIVRLVQHLFQLGIVRHQSEDETRSFKPSNVMLSQVDFACILSRAILALALDKVRKMVDTFGTGLCMELKCAAIQREIIVSLLLNKAFWGEKESKNVMSGLLELVNGVTSDDLVAFQKAKAGGMHALYELPTGVG